MNKHAIFHQAKSEFSYQYDDKTIHLLIRTQKDDFNEVLVNYGDPFDWISKDQKAEWVSELLPMEKRYVTDDYDYYFIQLEPKDLRCKYAFVLKEKDDIYFYGSKRMVKLDTMPSSSFEEGSFYDLSNYFNYPFLNKEDLADTPSWVKDTVWYQIFPDRFYSHHKKSVLPWGKLPVNNHETYGGDLLGVMDKLPYLKSIGVTGIYFTPLFLSPTAHKYDTYDYYQIDPQFGTNEDFKNLVIKAHELGIKVVLDAVLNHAGWGHPYFQDVIKHGKNSKYFNSFFIDKDPIINFPIRPDGKPGSVKDLRPNFKTFAYTPHMPKWNTEDEHASSYLLGAIEYWIKSYDIDGWRLDVSNEVSHKFLRNVKDVAKKAKKDTFIFGENWDSSMPWLRGDQMDSVMNYDLSIPMWQYFENKINLHQFKNELIEYTARTPKNLIENMFNQLDTHDTVRMLTRLNENVDRLKIAYLMMFASAGAPNIYYGTEVGLSGHHDPDNRRCFIWDESKWNMNLLNYIKQLVNLRNEYDAFKSSDYHFFDPNSASFMKKGTKSNLYFLINDQENIYEMTLNGSFKDLLTNEIMTSNVIKLEKYQTRILINI